MVQQAPPPTTPYGFPISLKQAKLAMDAAEAKASKNKWAIAIAIVDLGGNLVILHRIDNAQLSAARIAKQKARAAVEFLRPTKVFEDAIAGGGTGLRVLTFELSGAEGGIPIVSDGKIIGGIGVSEAASDQDGRVARAGAVRKSVVSRISRIPLVQFGCCR